MGEFLHPSVQEMMFEPAKVEHLSRLKWRLEANALVAGAVLDGRRKAATPEEMVKLLEENIDHLVPPTE